MREGLYHRLTPEKPKTNQIPKSEVSQKSKVGRRKADAPTFPHDSLKEVLKLARAIEENNAGKPYDRLDLAKAINASPNSSGFRQLITSSSRYGVTDGGYKADTIALTSLGSAIVAPTESNIGSYLRQALLKPDLFNKVYLFYDKKQIPREEFIKNSLKKQFGVLPEDVEACYKVLAENIKDYNLANDIKGNQFLQLDKLGSAVTLEEAPTSELESPQESEQTQTTTVQPITSEQQELKPLLKQIFIAHGKNRKPLEQLQKILDQFKVKYTVAVNEPHKGRPISSKVAELMKNCSSAIFIFTADEEIRDEQGNVSYRPSDNVVYELGAASVLYENKIVIFKEDAVDFASDFKDFGYISFEKDKLDAKTMELLKELVGFGILQISPA